MSSLTIPMPVTAESLLPILNRWHAAALRRLNPVQNHPEWLLYGTADQTHWAIQAQCTATAALAVLAGDGGDAGAAEEALRMLRYLFATHRSGTSTTVGGEKWGHHWISVLGLERLAHALPVLQPWLTDADREAWNRILLSESDFLLEGYPVVASIDGSQWQNKPESNLWNGSVLYRCALLFPDAPNAARYREKAISLILNGISTPSDATSQQMFSGKPMSEWHIGPNFTESFGLHHHAYLNVGYMVICLSQIAYFLLACRDEGITPAPEMLHHARELWQLVKSLTFNDGRLWRIGGDTRVRYCYCQDYAVPAWLLARDLWGDKEAEVYLANWFSLIAQEQGKEGEFLSRRLAGLETISPIYYSRLEGDRAVSVSLAIRWIRSGGLPESFRQPSLKAPAFLPAWSDGFHGAVMVRGVKRWASWVSEGAESPVGMVALPNASDMTEWGANLAGSVKGVGCTSSAKRLSEKIGTFPGGFLVSARYQWGAENDPAEGTGRIVTAEGHNFLVALPDDATVITLQRAVKIKGGYINETGGLNLIVPNDIFNGRSRTYSFDGKEHLIGGVGACTKAETIQCGQKLVIDGRLALQALYGGELQLRRPGKRTLNLKNSAPLQFSGEGAHLYCDSVAIDANDQQRFEQEGALLFDIGAILTVGAEPASGRTLSESPSSLKIIETRGEDDRLYRVVANFGTEPLLLPPLPAGTIRVGGTTKDSSSDKLASGEALLLCIPE